MSNQNASPHTSNLFVLYRHIFATVCIHPFPSHLPFCQRALSCVGREALLILPNVYVYNRVPQSITNHCAIQCGVQHRNKRTQCVHSSLMENRQNPCSVDFTSAIYKFYSHPSPLPLDANCLGQRCNKTLPLPTSIPALVKRIS